MNQRHHGSVRDGIDGPKNNALDKDEPQKLHSPWNLDAIAAMRPWTGVDEKGKVPANTVKDVRVKSEGERELLEEAGANAMPDAASGDGRRRDR